MKESKTMDFPLIDEVYTAGVTDVYFTRTKEVLVKEGKDPEVGIMVFATHAGIFCGADQIFQILRARKFQGRVTSLKEGDVISQGECGMQFFCKYSQFGELETEILGILASCTGWATAAQEVVKAAGMSKVICFGARHVHPNVAAIMDYSAIVGGCETCSTDIGAKLAGKTASGTMPHAMVLIMGDTVEAAKAFDRHIDSSVPRIVLVDTFQDECVESLRVAHAMKGKLQGIRVDTPSQRGGVTPALVQELRYRLDMEGFNKVHIIASGGMSPERIREFTNDGTNGDVDIFGVGSHIAGARPLDYTADIRQIDGKPIAKRGRCPGMRKNPRLKEIKLT